MKGNAMKITIILIAAALTGCDYDDAKAERQFYCDQVATWHADAARGIPEKDRAGWPPFDGECK